MAQKYVPVALRRVVRERAKERCEYCLIPEQLTLAAHWVDHFRLTGAQIEPLTAIGRVTVRLLQLNRRDRLEERELLRQLGLFPPPNLLGAETS